MSDESGGTEMGGIGGIIIKTVEKNMRDKLRSHGITTVEVRIVPKLDGSFTEFIGPEEDIERAKKCLGYTSMKDYLNKRSSE